MNAEPSSVQRIADIVTSVRFRPPEMDSVVTPIVALEALLERLADVCPDHERCEGPCGQWFCESCGLGTPGDCSHEFKLCAYCQYDTCRECNADLGEDMRAGFR